MDDDKKLIDRLKSQLKKEHSFNHAIKQDVALLCNGLTDLLKQVKEDERITGKLKEIRGKLEDLNETIISHRQGE